MSVLREASSCSCDDGSHAARSICPDRGTSSPTSCINRSHRLAPFNPTDISAQNVALRLLNLKTGDVLFDLGCGDGRFLVHAAASTKNAMKFVGIEYNAILAERGQQLLEACPEEIARRVAILNKDVLECTTEVTEEATAIFVYLVPQGLAAILPVLDKVRQKTGGRVVSYMFAVPGWQAREVSYETKGGWPIYLYIMD